MRVAEPAADLPMAMALVSAVTGIPVPSDVFAFGEVGLSGEVRQVPHAVRRITEACRLGFRHAVVPRSTPACSPGLELIRVDGVADAVNLVLRSRSRAVRGLKVAGS
jgi:DNA repair protein RadA/Sms